MNALWRGDGSYRLNAVIAAFNAIDKANPQASHI
jgi:hypothetical protein